jgi:L-fuculose-phosphate aldolase
MHAGWELCDLVAPFPEVFRYTRVGKNVEDFPALSRDLALQTAEHLVEENKIKFDIVGQKSHGVCSIGSNPWNAFEHVERVEHICKIVLLSGVRPETKKKNFKQVVLERIM